MKGFKKITCGCLSAAMIVTTLAVAPVTAEAAAPKLNKTSAEMTVGKKMTLKVQNVKKGTSIKWSSTKKGVASVSAKGVVTAKSVGKATIKAVVSKKTLKCKITVKENATNQPNTDIDTTTNQPNTDKTDETNQDTNTDPGAKEESKDISALLAGKSYQGTAVTPVGNIDVLKISFGTDGKATGSKMNETTMTVEEFSGTYQAVLQDKKVIISVEADGNTMSEELTVESEDFTKLSATKKIMGMDITVTVEEVKAE